MKSFLLFISLLSYPLVSIAQTIKDEQVEIKGAYKEISDNYNKDLTIIELLLDTNLNNVSARTSLIDSVERNANNFTPPVLYSLSNILFVLHKGEEAEYWYYIAQLRARYDVNRCTDKTVSAEVFNENFGTLIRYYALTHIDNLEEIVSSSINYVRTNDEKYDQRWINLTGKDAWKSSHSAKFQVKALTVDESKWATIKTETINKYYAEFKKALPHLKKRK